MHAPTVGYRSVLADSASLHRDPWMLQTPQGSLEISVETTTEQDIWTRLADPGLDDGDLRAADLPTPQRLRLRMLLDACERRGLLTRQLLCDGEVFASRRLIARSFAPADLHPDRPHVLSRFALCRSTEDGLLLESPLSLARVLLHDERATALLATFQQGVPDLGADDPVAAAFAELLATVGLLLPLDDDGHTIEATDPALAQWSFHDLLFHARSRFGRHDDPFGGTYPFAESGREPPARLREPVSDQIVGLERPDLDERRRTDPSFTDVLESRRSIRQPSGTPLTKAVLAEFLYRCCRLQSSDEPALRPTPSGGAIHELEIYLVVRDCPGLDAGLYRYAPARHELEVLPAPVGPQAELLRFSGDVPPAVHVVMAARFPAVTWKYASMPYAVILKNVGCLMQTMYLVATAMDLAPCAIGAGDADLFARLTGLPYAAEGSVGEFSLY